MWDWKKKNGKWWKREKSEWHDNEREKEEDKNCSDFFNGEKWRSEEKMGRTWLIYP